MNTHVTETGYLLQHRVRVRKTKTRFTKSSTACGFYCYISVEYLSITSLTIHHIIFVHNFSLFFQDKDFIQNTQRKENPHKIVKMH